MPLPVANPLVNLIPGVLKLVFFALDLVVVQPAHGRALRGGPEVFGPNQPAAEVDDVVV